VSELIKFKEQRHNNLREVMAMVISGILGGLVGAVFAYFYPPITSQNDSNKIIQQVKVHDKTTVNLPFKENASIKK
jgi:hypothetical protein